MAEKWVSTTAGRHLSGRRRRDTAPEVLLRKALHAAGGRFRLQRRLAHGCTPDIVLPGRRVAVFVDGDYWHGCPEHGRKRPFTGPNAELWEAKMRRNRERDVRSTALAESLGWTVVRVWECQVLADAPGIAASILSREQHRAKGDAARS
ncbi:very short patch repair endonuclease [Blastococcus sp. TF02A-35]|uniref:very short patch repair endonuclease n=1 Tax=Blastococcus sp. TF02A-35 TaxID=2559612 RepID=UPI0010741E6A|nr:very short patch repair endonuclease [Blastococcus sp. TF02A_35]TFV44850.1 very short patch repair endonuclease [Blastococcus sp. TF02A_35]